MSEMTDLSYTQTSRAMSSKPLARVERQYRPIWVIAAYNNKKRRVVRSVKRSNPSFFTSL